MTRYYVSHYFDFKNIGIFLLVSLIGLIAVLAIVLFTAKLQVHRRLNFVEGWMNAMWQESQEDTGSVRSA